MTDEKPTKEDVEQAERNLLQVVFQALLALVNNRRFQMAVVGMLLAGSGWATSKCSSEPTTSMGTSSDPCANVISQYQKGSYSVTKTLTACLATLCLANPTACQPTPTPNPPPQPIATGGVSGIGGSGPIATGGSLGTGGSSAAVVQFPPCNPPTFAAPSPKQIDQLKRSLKPRRRFSGASATFGIVTSPPSNVMWMSNDPFCGNQGALGACVAFTAEDWATTLPATLSFSTQSAFNSAALSGYHWITANDPYPGTYPPDDTGSDTLTGCKWLVHMGYAKACNVLSGKAQVLDALKSGSIMSGKNWPDKWMSANACARMPSVTSADIIDGGHDVLLVGYDLANDEEIYQNHWDNNWGTCIGPHCGYFRVKASDDFGSVIDSDFVQPVR